jgi:hypothetical protein
VGEVIDALVEIYNGILRIGRLAREVSCTSHQHAVICPIHKKQKIQAQHKPRVFSSLLLATTFTADTVRDSDAMKTDVWIVHSCFPSSFDGTLQLIWC